MPKTQASPGYIYHQQQNRLRRSRGPASMQETVQAVRAAFRDMAQPSVQMSDDGQSVILEWRNYDAPSPILQAQFPHDQPIADSAAAVTKRGPRTNDPVIELGVQTLEELKATALECTRRWRPNVWEATAYRKFDGDYRIDVTDRRGANDSSVIHWEIRNRGRIVGRGHDWTLGNAMRAAEAARNELARQAKRDLANRQRGEQRRRNMTVHYYGEVKPDGGQATLCNKVVKGRRKMLIHGRAGVDIDAPGVKPCRTCRDIDLKHQTNAETRAERHAMGITG